MDFTLMLWGAEKLGPAEYWCPDGKYHGNIALQPIKIDNSPCIHGSCFWQQVFH